MNLRKAGGTAVVGRASGFLGTEACTTRDLAARLDVTLAQTSLRNHHEQSRERDEDLSVRPVVGQAPGVALSATVREKYGLGAA
jgi:hypothetical protein